MSFVPADPPMRKRRTPRRRSRVTVSHIAPPAPELRPLLEAHFEAGVRDELILGSLAGDPLDECAARERLSRATPEHMEGWIEHQLSSGTDLAEVMRMAAPWTAVDVGRFLRERFWVPPGDIFRAARRRGMSIEHAAMAAGLTD